MTAAYDVPYMERTREYYRAQGYTRDYKWAHHTETPFHTPVKLVKNSRIAVITTAMPDTELGRKQRQIYSIPSRPLPEFMYTDELSWDKKATHTDDVASFLPLFQLKQFAAEKLIGSLARRYHCVPTDFSHRNTTLKDAPVILERCQQDQVDLAILVPL